MGAVHFAEIILSFVRKEGSRSQPCDVREQVSSNEQHNENSPVPPNVTSQEPDPKEETYSNQEIKDPALGHCRHVKADGSRCKANAQRGSEFCFFHDGATAEQRDAARVHGGQERSRKATVLPADTPNAPLKTAAEVTSLLAATINQVRRGEVDPRISNAVGYLAGILLKAKQQDEVEQRVARLESLLASKWKDPNAAIRPISEAGSFEFVKPEAGGQA